MSTGKTTGRFITFEGGEGSGKSTQLERLASRLRTRGLDPLKTREPGGTPLGEGIRELLRVLNRAATSGLEPDLTLLFDLDPEAGLARRARAAMPANRLDREPDAFHARVRARYLELAAAEPGRFVVLDASLAPERLEALVWAALEPRLIAARA